MQIDRDVVCRLEGNDAGSEKRSFRLREALQETALHFKAPNLTVGLMIRMLPA
jgi:hypothetical protein